MISHSRKRTHDPVPLARYLKRSNERTYDNADCKAADGDNNRVSQPFKDIPIPAFGYELVIKGVPHYLHGLLSLFFLDGNGFVE